MFRFCSLGSGSKGNATLVEFNQQVILIDSGFSAKTLESRMGDRNVDPKSIIAVLVTHEHSDHFKGVPAFANRHNIPVWMSYGTSLFRDAVKIKSLNVFDNHSAFQINHFLITPVAVPHDAREASQFVVEAGGKRLGILTDLGHITAFIEEQFSSLDGLMLEFNHDYQRLMESKYPAKLKQRVAGDLGHLNNHQALAFLNSERLKKLQHLIAMHLSEENNCPELVSGYLSNLSARKELKRLIAHQDRGFDWLTIA